MALADRVVILRGGRVAGELEGHEIEQERMVQLIVGHDLVGYRERLVAQRRYEAGESSVALEVEEISGRRLRGVSFTIAKGEILGIAGLTGCGKSELVRILAGAEHPRRGRVRFLGKDLPLGNPHGMLASGVAYVPQDRRGHGCLPALSIRENLTLSDIRPYWHRGWLDQRLERRDVAGTIERYDIRGGGSETVLSSLSGGNQQKVVVAKGMHRSPRLMVLDEPTQGVDVGARAEISAIIRATAQSGMTILIASTDFEELATLRDRVLILDRGRLSGSIQGAEITKEMLTLLCTGASGVSVQEREGGANEECGEGSEESRAAEP